MNEAIDQLKEEIKILEKAKDQVDPNSESASNYERLINDFEYAVCILEGAGDLSRVGFLIESVRRWATDRRIIGVKSGSTAKAQFDKLLEEVEELDVAISESDMHEAIDAIGDCTVVLINLAELIGCSFEKCLASAYDEIKNRKGMMIDGKFVKESDLENKNQ
jgi:NTP pyrophosphatase (non-canonical NTP hydrolase)